MIRQISRTESDGHWCVLEIQTIEENKPIHIGKNVEYHHFGNGLVMRWGFTKSYQRYNEAMKVIHD